MGNAGPRLRLPEPHIDGGQDAARNRQQMRREDDRLCIDADLLQQFTGVAMRKNAIGREIIGCIHEMRFGGGRLARSAHAAFRIGHNAVLEIDDAGIHQGLERRE